MLNLGFGNDTSQLPGKSGASHMAGNTFVALPGQGGPDIVNACTFALSRQLKGSLYDVGLFGQFRIPAIY
ncbi:MAG: hypothetical protein JWO15_1587 [Sphingomonadales bacterium]|jgi:hypothetical protein|nr:hypothetical protein [Sphingomonadales bacterium]